MDGETGWRTLRRACGVVVLGLAAIASGPAHAVDLQIPSFTDSPDPAIRGGIVTMTITAENNDGDTASNVVVTYPLPANTVFVSASDAAAPGACAHDGATPGTVTCTYATLRGSLASPPGPTRTITVQLRTTGSTVSTLNSTVSIASADADTNPANNQLTQNTTIGDGADLTATMTGSPNPALGGGLVTWTVSGSNLGPNASGSISFTTTLPGVLTYVAAGSGGNGWSCPGGTVNPVTCTRGALAAGAAYGALPIVTRITGAAGGTVTLSGSISSTVGDPEPSNNTPVASVTVQPGADLAVAQDPPSPPTVVAGNTATFVLRPSNLGPSAQTAGATVTFPLPSGFAVVSATGSAGWSCASSGAPPVVTCTFAGSLASGAAGTLTVVATTPAVSATTAYNGITATIAGNAGGPADPDASNNTAARNLVVNPDGADLRIAKVKGPSLVAAGAAMQSTITVGNNGPNAAAAGTVTVVDTLDPSRETFVSAAGTNWSCTFASPAVTCVYNAALASGADAPALVVSSIGTGSGAATNTAVVSYSGTPGDYDTGNNTAAATVSVTNAPNSSDLQTTLGASTAGGVATTVEVAETQIVYTAVVANKAASTGPARDVVFTQSIPGRTSGTNVTVVPTLTNTSGLSTATFTCTGQSPATSGDVVCTQGAGSELRQGDSVTFVVTAARPLLDVTNAAATASAVSTSQGDQQPSDNTAAVNVTIQPIADVELVSKVLAANPVLAGTNAVYTITARNNGPSAAQGVQVADVFTLPAGDTGFTFVGAAASDSGTCGGLVAGTVYTPPATPTVTCSWPAAVPSGGTRTVTVTLRPNWKAGTAVRTFDNTATVSTTTAEDSAGGTGTAVNAKSLTLTINPAQIDLLVNNTDSPDPLGYDPATPANNDVTYTVALSTGTSPSLATGVGFTFTMTPPAGKTIVFRGDGSSAGVAAASPTGTIPGALCDNLGASVTGPASLTVTCPVPAPRELSGGSSINRYLVWRVGSAPASGGDVYATVATVSANETDTNPGNDSESENTTVRVRADLSIVKTPSLATVQLRQPFTWSVVVTNNGPGDSQTTSLTDTLPAGMAFTATPTFTTSGGGAGNCTVAGQTLTCALGLVANTGTATVTVPVRATAYPSGGTTQNCATATTSEVDPVGANSASVCTAVAVQRSSLAGVVFEDRDRAGANGGTPQALAVEPAIQGVAIALTGTDAYGNAVSATATTDSNGAYAFANLSPSDASGYTITETQPAGYVNSNVAPPTSGALAPSLGGTHTVGGAAGNSSHTVVVGSNQAGVRYNFPEVRRPSLSGFVYIDANANGVRNAGTDPAVGGAIVRLLDPVGTVVGAAPRAPTTGAYAFTGLDPFSVYTLEEPLPASPAGLANGPINPGTVGGAACASGCTAQPNTPAAGTDRIASIDLGAGTDGAAFNFGELRQTTVSGTVYVDRNRDGAMDPTPTDGRLAGVTVRLVQGADCATGTTLQTQSTDTAGGFSFASVVAGAAYLVCETQPAGYGEGTTTPGTSASTPSLNTIAIGFLPPGGSSGNLFGERVGSLSGSVYQDFSPGAPANTDNGQRDAGEAGIANVPVTLTGTTATGVALALATTTDASGNWRFDDLLQSDASGYTVAEGAIPPASGTYVDGKDTAGTLGGGTATNDRFTAIPVAAGAAGSGYLFGELPIAPISGTVYVDRNRNGTLDATPADGRIGGVTVRLVQGASCAAGTALQTTLTAPDGTFSFSGAAAGLDYLLCETQPAGYGQGSVNPGTNGASAGTDAIRITNLPAAGSPNHAFGERVGSIAGHVFLDQANDGARTGDPGIAGVTVTRSGTDAAGAAVARVATTDATGAYRFDDVLAAGAGGYTLTEQAAQPVVGGRTTLSGRTSAGTAGGTASAVAATPSTIAAIALGAAVDAADNDFAEILPVAVSGSVFVDLNDDGLQQLPGDLPLATVTIVVTGTDDLGAAVTRTVQTAADGSFAVADLRPGTYTIAEPTQPPGTSNGKTTAGSAGGTATAPATTPSAIAGVVLTTPGAASTANRFAEIANSSSIAGRVWLDADDDGIFDADEAGLAGVTIALAGTDTAGGAVSRTTTTDALGAWSFSSLPPGTYTVTEPTQPPATLNGATTAGRVGGVPSGTATPRTTTPSAISSIVLGVGQASAGNDFAEIPDSPDLMVAKQAVETRFTANNVGTYAIRVRNAGTLPTSGFYTVSDRLPAGLTLDATPTGAGWSCTGAVGANAFSCTSAAVLAALQANPNAITARVRVAPSAASPAVNAVLVEGGGEAAVRAPTAAERAAFAGDPAALPACDPAMAHNACRVSTAVQAAAALAGTVWFDTGSTRNRLDAGDRRLGGWTVEIVDGAGTTVATAQTATDGSYRVGNLVPGVELRVRFRDPASNVVWGYPVNGETAPGSSGAPCGTAAAIAGGTASSCPGTGGDPPLTVVLAPGQTLLQQSLPIDPSGVVYASGTRQPVPGSVVTLAPSGACVGWNPATSLVAATLGGYTVNGAAVSTAVGTDGLYQFLFTPAAPASCTFTLAVTPPSGFRAPSTLIPPQATPLVPAGAPGSTVAVQPQANAPTGAVGPATTYFLAFVSGSAGANIVHNHIPLDTATPSGLSLSKSGDRRVVEQGDTVRYTVTVARSGGPLPLQVTVVDRLPAGFTFVPGTASVGGVPIADPVGRPGPRLVFQLGPMTAGNALVLQYRARVDVGSAQGDGTNRALGFGCGVPSGCTTPDGGAPLPGSATTNEGRHTVRVTGGVFGVEACLLGKVFVDCNGNHVQDAEEIGIPGVRLVLSDGTLLVTDSEGKYSYCGLPPRSHVLRVDETTMPRGSRLTTSSNRNLGDAGSLWLDLKNGELHRGDFVEGSCSAPVVEQVKARRAQGEVRSVETESPRLPSLRFDSNDKGPRPRTPAPGGTP